MYCIDLFFSLSSPAVRRRYMYLVFEEATRRTETVENAIRFLTSGSASPLSRVDNSDLALPSASTLAGTNRTDSRRPRAAAPDRLTSEELSRVVEVSQAVLGDLYHPDGNFNRSSALAADLCLA